MRNKRFCALAVVMTLLFGMAGCALQKSEPVQEDVRTGTIELEETTVHFVDAAGREYEMTVNPDAPGHEYDWSCLTNDGQNLTYIGDDRYTIRKGIDVSYHQGEIDWKAVKGAGYEFVILRVGYRGYGKEGKLCLDTAFPDYVEGAQEAGLDVGVYLFSQAVNETEAVEEADLVIDALKDIDIVLPVVFDPELISNDDARTDDVSGAQFTANAIAFCEKIKDAGYQPMVYSNMMWEAYMFDMAQLSDYAFWYADYEKTPQTPYAFSFWQYSESGKVPGIDGNCDLDVQFIRK
jgi:GH25 family lysozyme M1 (1,4-beta-N-acetylmuramidase)